MKLLNWNISIKIDNSENVAEFIFQHNPEVITIQEVLRHFSDHVFRQYQSKEIIERVIGNDYPHKFFAPIWVAEAIKHGDKMHRDFGGLVEQGNEILSKYPILSGANEFFYKHFSYAKDWSNWSREDHGRAVQITELDIEGKKLQIFNLHGIWTADKLGDKRTIDECKYLVEAAQRKNMPTIIVGDFNLLPHSEGIKLINKNFRNLIEEFGIESTRPNFNDGRDEGNQVVDYIFVNDQIDVKGFEVLDTEISDHLPLILNFEIKK